MPVALLSPPARVRAEEGAAETAPRPFTVLCVDDDADHRLSLAMVLRLEGYQVLQAGTGGEALARARGADLVILDVGLPDLSGFAVCERIKSDPATALVPVILLSGYYTGSDDRAEGLEGGGDVYLVKPVEPRELLGQVKALLRIRQAEAALLFRDRAIRAVASGIVITDAGHPDNPILYASPGFERLTGYAQADVLGKNCRFLQGPDTDPEAAAEVRAAVREGRECSVELLNYRQDGSPFWNHLVISPVRDEAGRLAHFVGVQTDVTERRQLEEQFRQAQKMEAVGRLAGGVAHDFNNLLTVINGYSSILLAELHEHDRFRPMVEEIQKAGERAAALTGQLLAFSRKQILQPKVLDLNALVAGARNMLARLIGEDVDLVTTPAPGLARIKADAGQVEQVLVNLAVNARDAMPQGGRLTVETANVVLDDANARDCPEVRPGPYVLLAVTDTGTGMDRETQARIFEPFFTTKGPGKGTGLGLAMVYGFVKSSGGHIKAYSEVGVGTTFKVYFPALGDAETTGERRAATADLPGGAETVLLAEDEPGVRDLTGHLLRRLGYRVLSAANGAEALRVAADHAGRIDLLLTDVVMPGLSGRQLAEAVRACDPRIKVLYLSGYTDDAVVRHGVLEANANFLQKPFTHAALASKVRQVLDGAG